MLWQYTPYIFPLILAGALSVGLAVFVWQRHPNSGTKPFIALMLGVAIWSWAYALELSSASINSQLFWAKAAYWGIEVAPIAWLAVVLQQTGRERWVTWRNAAALMILPAFTLLIVGTNEFHGLFWNDLVQFKVSTFSVFQPTYGIWFWINALYLYSILLTGTGLLVRTLLRSTSMYRGQAAALLASALPPWFGNILFVSGLNPFPGLDITPFAFTMTGSAIAWGMLRFRLMDIVPIARHAVIEGMTDGILVLDKKRRILDINPSAHRIIGCDILDVIGKPAETVFSNYPELLRACMDEGSSNLDISFNEADETFYYDVTTSWLYDGRDRNAGKIVTIRDITEQKRARNALRQIETERQESERKHLENQLHQAQKMEGVGRLTGGVAHDFNNLMTGILGYTQLCLMSLPPEFGKIRRDLDEIQKTAVRASTLTHQLLTFARRPAGEPQIFCINDVILEMDRMLRRLIGEDVELRTRTAHDLGNIRADPGKMEQVLVNMVVNARDAMSSGGDILIETSNVLLDETHSGKQPDTPPVEYVLLSIADTGTGMTEEVKTRLFDVFFTTKEEGKGTGLGLSTCKKIIQESGGFMDLDSKLGHGTTFKIYLPLVKADNTTIADGDEPDEVMPGTETILLVEDESLVREVAAQMLREQGYRVLEASIGTEALELGLTHSQDYIHLLLTDIVMPGMGGKELAAHLKLIHPESKVLFTSGYTDEILESHGVDHTKVAFMEKPFTPDTLARSVREVLDAPFDDSEVPELVESPR